MTKNENLDSDHCTEKNAKRRKTNKGQEKNNNPPTFQISSHVKRFVLWNSIKVQRMVGH